MRRRPKMLSGIQKRAKATAKSQKQKRRKDALGKAFNRAASDNAPKAIEEPHHSEDGAETSW